MENEILVMKKCLHGAGAILKKHFTKIGYTLKGRANLLTKADLESQKYILGQIKKSFPEHDFLAEENGIRETGSSHVWVIDPLDGTLNYAHGYPASVVSIGIMKDSRPFAGGIYDPFRNELFIGMKGKGATLNGRKINVSPVKKLEDSLLVTGFAFDRAEIPDFYCGFYSAFLRRCHDIRRSGSAALDMAWTACGRTEGFWEFKLNPWDVCAGRVLVEEAGGKVTDFEGKPWTDMKAFGKQTLATNGLVHAEMLATIRKELRKNNR